MELQKVIEMRQSVRKFKDINVPNEHLEQMFAAAAMAPSAKNIQNWHFVAIKKDELKKKVADIISGENMSIATEMRKVDEKKAERFIKMCKNFTLFATEAPVLVIGLASQYTPTGLDEVAVYASAEEVDKVERDLSGKRNPGMQSIGAFVEHFILKATELGYGTCWLTSGNYAGAKIEKLMAEEKIFDNDKFFMVCMLALGVPEGEPKSPEKKPLEDVYTIVE